MLLLVARLVPYVVVYEVVVLRLVPVARVVLYDDKVLRLVLIALVVL